MSWVGNPSGLTMDSPPPDDEVMSDSDAFCEVFPQAYLVFHRRDGRRSELTNASGRCSPTWPGRVRSPSVRPLGISTAPSRWSATSITQLEGHGLPERRPDPDDRRRTWSGAH